MITRARPVTTSSICPRPQRTRSVAFACLAFNGLVFAACAPSVNTVHLAANAPAGLANPALFRQALARRPAAEASSGAEGEAPAALAVGASTDELIGARLDRAPTDARPWRTEIAASAPLLLAPGIVVFGSGHQLVALSSESGRRLWAMPARGASALASSADADQTALLLNDRWGRRWIAVYDRAARERLRVSADAALGAPALLGGTLLVPTGEGYVSAIDLATSAERARIRLGSLPLQPLWFEDRLLFGGPPWVEAARDAPGYSLPRRPLPEPVRNGPGEPSMPSAGKRPVDATRVYIAPAARAASAGADARDIYMATYGRIAFGLEREHGTLQWVIALPGRVLSAAAVAGGFAVCDDSGSVRLLAAQTGHVERQWQLLRERRVALGEPTLMACALSSGRVRWPDPDAAISPTPPLLDQLASVLRLSDPTLTEAQRFLSRELAARPEPEATRVLIELVTRHSLDRLLQSEAEDLLATRRVGQDHMLAALADAVARGEQALPPIAPLGEALAALGERRAAPLLAHQLNRPAHTAHAIARAAAALEVLASEAEYDELSVFFSLHRTSADDAEWVAAVVSIGRTLLRVGGPEARTLLQFAVRDPLTVPDVKNALERELGTSAASIGGS
jgi:hypothetical protein